MDASHIYKWKRVFINSTSLLLSHFYSLFAVATRIAHVFQVLLFWCQKSLISLFGGNNIFLGAITLYH